MTRSLIQSRLILAAAAAIAAIIGGAGLIMTMQRKAAIEDFATATTNLGNGMGALTAQPIAAIDRSLSKIAGVLTAPHRTAAEIRSAMASPATLELLTGELLNGQRSAVTGADSLSVIGADGETVNTAGGGRATPDRVSGSDYFSHFRAADDHAAFVGAPAKDPDSGRWTAVLARRIDDREGKFAGLVTAKLALSDLQRFYQLAMQARRTVYLLRRDGLVLVRYPARDGEIGKQIPGPSPWYAVVARGGGFYHAPGYFDAVPVIAAVRPLRDLPFVVEASVTEADTLTGWYKQIPWIMLGAIVAIAATCCLLRLFARQYRRLELSELALAAKNIQIDIANQQLDATLSNLSQGVARYDDNQVLVLCNRRYCELYDLPEEAVRPGMTLAEIAELRLAAGSLDFESVSEYLAAITERMREGVPYEAIKELANGRILANRALPLPGRGWVVTNEDITERRAAEAKIAFLARHDVLTGLANRALFVEQLEHAMALAKRGKKFAVHCLDLDRFKAVNDSFGHPVGDALLRAVADRLRAAVRESDIIARLGGDEFAILQLDITESTESALVASRIVQVIHQPFELTGQTISVGTSIGIALAPQDSVNPVQLMSKADLALYRAKQEGRGTWRFFEPAMDVAARTRQSLEADLREALPLGQFELHYQPLACGRARLVCGFEALLRWRHPVRGLLPPNDFIAAAEDIGIMPEIGAWVLREACAEAAAWPDHFRIAVNLSTRQFRSRTLVELVAGAIRDSGIDPHRLELEVTEAVPLHRDQAILAILEDLRGLGAHIVLDRFGTGSCSLSYLRHFRFDTVKIDRTLVGDLAVNDKSVLIVQAIIALAASLRMNVAAAGVETESQFEFLIGAGCSALQGLLIGEPVLKPIVTGRKVKESLLF